MTELILPSDIFKRPWPSTPARCPGIPGAGDTAAVVASDSVESLGPRATTTALFISPHVRALSEQEKVAPPLEKETPELCASPQTRPHKFDQDLVAVIPSLTKAAAYRLRNYDLVQEMVQRTVFLALNAWEQFQPGTNFKGWVHRILFNEIMSHFRRAKRVYVPLETPEVQSLQAREIPADEAVEASERAKLIENLPPILKNPLKRVCIDGAFYHEAAKEFGITPGSLRSRIWRARSEMERMWGEA